MNGHVARDRGRYYEGVDPSLLPEQALTMPAELVRIDRLLDDDRFFAPYREFSTPRSGDRRSRLRRTCG